MSAGPTHALVLAFLLACGAEQPTVPPDPEPALEEEPTLTDASLPVEEVVKLPRPGLAHPVALAFEPEGELVTFLDSTDGSLQRQLYAWDPRTGERRQIATPPDGGVKEGELSLEEQLRRERLRERGLGITRYSWSEQGGRILVPIAGGVWLQDGVEGELREVVPKGEHAIQSPRLSADGERIAWVSDDEIYVKGVDSSVARQLTSGARGTGRTHGLAEYIAQEEMGRMSGFWWSRDGSQIAYTEVDETHIPVWRIPHSGKDTPTWEDHRYPFAGADNARLRLAVVPFDGGRPVWMDLTCDGALVVEYLARVHWLEDGSLLAQVQNRAQTRLDLIKLDPATGTGKVLRTETSRYWVNLHRDLRELKGTYAGQLLWSSERTGYKHLYRLDAQGNELAQLTSGDWSVGRVVSISETDVYFLGRREAATESHLYSVSLEGGEIRRITTEPGMHEVRINEDHTRFIDQYSNVHQPPRLVLRDMASGAEIGVIHEPQDPRLQKLNLPPVELFTFENRDGVQLDAALYLPEGDGPFPLLVHVYGGPHAQLVANSWGLTADMRNQWLASKGWAVLRVDNQGAANRGLAFEGALRWNMGDVEVRDQVDGVRHLVAQGLVDQDRVGIYGWSYGGYMTIMSLLRAPDVFHAGVAGAPVTHWDGYDTHYTERYMGTPQENPEGYRVSSAMAHVDALEGDLLLVHGMIDENVHFRHTARFVNALVKAGKRYELLAFPDERHAPRDDAGRAYMEETLLEFFERTLPEDAP